MVGANLFQPPILFFLLGVGAALARSDLEVPQPLPRLFSLYLLVAIGLRGGHELALAGLGGQVALTLGTAIAFATLLPFAAYGVLRRLLDAPNAAALAASYGSISAVTFVTATAFLENQAVPYGPHMIAAMALMESPAILVGVLLARRNAGASAAETSWTQVAHAAFLSSAVVLLLGSLAIGALVGDTGYAQVRPLFGDLFNGVLALFLLDLGIVAARRLREVVHGSIRLVAFATVFPIGAALAALAVGRILALGVGDGLLLATLAASASYIAVPAAMRVVVPGANPGLYVGLPLGVTFPFNVIVGIPLYFAIATALRGG